MEKFLDYLEEAERKVQTADHMIYVTFPLIKDKRLFLQILSIINQSVLNCINCILQYEYLNKNIALSENSSSNLRTFKEKCAYRYGINDFELGLVSELIELSEKHKKSSMEFMRNSKVVIISENMIIDTLSIEKVKEFLEMAKNMLAKAKKVINY